MMLRRSSVVGIALLLVGTLAPALGTEPPDATPILYPDHLLKSGGFHFHSAYSDGEAGSRPADVFAAGVASGMDFMFVTEHSEWLALPVEADEDCLDPTARPATECLITSPDGLSKWETSHAAAAQVRADTPGFLAQVGFEWSSPIQGHVVTTGSANYDTAYNDGGLLTMSGYYAWLQTDPAIGGGSDGLGIFAHPGREEAKFEDFRYDPAVDPQMIGVEVFNRGNTYWEGGLAQALDNGWHTGAIGAVDDHGPDWGRLDRARTVVFVPSADWTPEALRAALEARHFYATFSHSIVLRMRANGRDMGSTLTVDPGEEVELLVEAVDPEGAPITALEQYSNGGELVASIEGPFPDNHAVLEAVASAAGTGETWFTAAVVSGGERIAFTSPIWVRSA